MLIDFILAPALYLYLQFNTTGDFFDSDGVRMHYMQAGEGTPVILVHGLAINAAAQWKFPLIYQRLSRHYRVIAFDNRGAGKSDAFYDPDAYGMELVEDVIRLMDHLEIERAHVVGYSMGGFITLKLAVTYPDRLLSVAPCGAGWTADTTVHLHRAKEMADAWDAGGAVLPPMAVPAPIASFGDQFVRWFIDFKAASSNLRAAHEIIVREEEVRANTVPMLCIVGENDTDMRALGEELGATASRAETVVLRGENHETTVFSPMFYARLLAFLKEHTP